LRSFKSFLVEYKTKASVNASPEELEAETRYSQAGTSRFYISSSNTMYSGDAMNHTHHSMGARGSEIQGGITHHKDDDTFHYAAYKYDTSKEGNRDHNIQHPKLKALEGQGMKRGVWDMDNGRVVKGS
jgi:hypothetical protein